MDFDKYFSLLSSPNRAYAIYPIIHGGIVSGRSDEHNAKGFAGVVGNVPYGEGYPNDEAEWANTAEGFRAYTKKGMRAWIYDEKGYPSGGAGGVVTDQNRDFIAEGLVCYEYWRTLTGPHKYRADIPEGRLFKALLLPLGSGEIVDVTHFADGRGTLRMDIPAGSYRLFLTCVRRMFDGTHAAESYSEPRDYVNLLDADATRAFLSVTHEKYAEHLKDELGKSIFAFFTDEPSLIAWNIRGNVYPTLPWHRDFPQNFIARYGYAIELAVAAVITGRGEQVIKRRCDFWELVADTVAENYFGVIQNWCKAHNVASSGHMLWEEDFHAHINCYGSFYRCARRLDIPGIDQLDSEPNRLMKKTRLPIARFLASFADVYGSGEAFTEFSDHTSRMDNRIIGIDWIRASINWHIAMGINNLTSYYSFAGLSDEDLRGLNLYASRIGTLMREGKRDSQTAVLYPDAAIWARYTPSVKPEARDESPEFKVLQDIFCKVSWELLGRQVDFDYIDEQLIQNGEIKSNHLVFNSRSYSTLILPASFVLCDTTVDKLAKLLKSGVKVVCAGGLPEISRERGEAPDFYEKLSPYIGKNLVVTAPNASKLLPPSARIKLDRAVRVLPQNLSSVMIGARGEAEFDADGVISADLLSHTRKTADGYLFFLCNMGANVYDGILLSNAQNCAELRPLGGSSSILEKPPSGGFTFKLNPYESKIFALGI